MGKPRAGLRRLRSWAWGIPLTLILAVAASGHLWGKVVALAVLSGVIALGIGLGIGLWVSGVPDSHDDALDASGAPSAESRAPRAEGAESNRAAESDGRRDEPVGQPVKPDAAESPVVVAEPGNEPEPVAASMRGVKLGGARLRGADLRGVDLRGADLTDADLRGANLEGARLGSTRP